MYERDERGVRVRADKKGDAWANAHRDALGNKYYLQDVDAMFGYVAFGHNTGERLFLEYVPDSYENRGSWIREYGYVALFDRKTSEQAAFSSQNSLSASVYLHLCRRLAAGQPIAPRFFFVIGGQEPPWEMIEISIESGEETGQRAVIRSASDWSTIWAALGLADMRNTIKQWIDPA